MKKSLLKLITFLLVSPFCLLGCTKLNNNPLIYKSDVKEMVNINSESLSKIIESDVPSLLFIGSTGCSSCDAISNYLNSYINTTSINAYHYDISTNLDYRTIFENYPNVFKEQTWPQIIITKAKEQLKKLDIDHINNERQFVSQMNSIVKISKTIQIRSTNTIESGLLDNEYFFYIYDISNKENYQKYTNFLLDKIENNPIKSYLIDSFSFKDGKDLIKQRLQITYDSFALIKKNGNIVVAEYSDDVKLEEIANLL